MKYLCKKNLYSNSGIKTFTKGVKYDVCTNMNYACDDCLFILWNDNQDCNSITEDWTKHFTKVETKNEQNG